MNWPDIISGNLPFIFFHGIQRQFPGDQEVIYFFQFSVIMCLQLDFNPHVIFPILSLSLCYFLVGIYVSLCVGICLSYSSISVIIHT